MAHQALERNSGARGLRAILEAAMLDIMYDIPSRTGIKEVVVSEDVIVKHEPSWRELRWGRKRPHTPCAGAHRFGASMAHLTGASVALRWRAELAH